MFNIGCRRLSSIRAVRALSLTGATALVLAGCTTGTSGAVARSPSPVASATQLPCVASMLELGPAGMAPNGLAHAGPLWFSAFGRFVAGSRAILPPGGGPPDGQKVVIVPDPASSGVVELSGTDCASNAGVRFCYLGCSWNTRLQAAVAVLSVDTPGLDLTGYMVFPGSGLMRLSVKKNGQLAGETFIQVPPD